MVWDGLAGLYGVRAVHEQQDVGESGSVDPCVIAFRSSGLRWN